MEKILKLPVVPLRDVVVFPHITLPLYVGREKSLRAIEEAQKNSSEIILVAQKNGQASDPSLDEIYTVGTRASIKQFAKLSDGNVKLLIEGRDRVEIRSLTDSHGFFEAECEPIPVERTTPEVEQKWMSTLIKHL